MLCLFQINLEIYIHFLYPFSENDKMSDSHPPLRLVEEWTYFKTMKTCFKTATGEKHNRKRKINGIQVRNTF